MTTKRPVTLLEAVLPLVTLVTLLIAGALTLRLTSELLIVIILIAAAVAGFIAARHGRSWDDIQRSAGNKIGDVLPALLILLVIGMLIASWMFSGTIPFFVYVGIRLVRPEYLVVTAFLATALMSLATGTSWGSAGTIGVALMGVAVAVGAPLGATAGAIVSGAYFGDKMSPLSDSTNISAIGAGAPLYTHIRHMVYTALPSFVVALIVYAVFAPVSPPTHNVLVQDTAQVMLGELTAAFRLSWITLIPPAVVVWSIIRRVPPALAITLSSLIALLIGVLLQGFGVDEAVRAAVGGFRADMLNATPVGGEWSGAFMTLVQRGGLYSMATTFVVVIAAFLVAAGMEVAGSLNLLIDRMLGAVRSVFGLIASTMAAGATMIALTSHGGVTALLIGGLFQPAYHERGLAPENLSRSIEDSVTITEPLMPWTVSAIFMATTLGVSTVTYAPWAIFCYGGPVFSLLLAGLYRWSGFGIARSAERPITPAYARHE